MLNKVGIRLRLVALFVTIFGSIFIVFSLVLYRQLIRDHQKEFDTFLYNYVIDVARATEVDLFGDINLHPNIFFESEKVFPFALGDTYIQVHSTVTGRTLAKSRSLGPQGALPYERDEWRHRAPNDVAIFHKLSEGEARHHGLRPGNYRMVDYYIDKVGPWDFVLQVAVPMQLLDREKKALQVFLLFGIPILLLVATLAGWYVSGRALAPLKAIISTARNLNAHQLSARVPVPQSRDEIYELVETLNAMLAHLEGAFKSQESFIADASHQLKTPLAILRGELDLMLNKPRSAEEVRDFLQSTSQEVNYLARIVEDMLNLARVEAAQHVLEALPVRMDEILLEVTSRLENAAAAKQVRFQIQLDESTSLVPPTTPFMVKGDADLLRCLCENLVSNAIKYAPSESVIHLKLADETSGLQLWVRDQGPGVAPADAAKIFDRFFRGENNRVQVTGSGLGLAIAKKIADLHEAQIWVESDALPGATFRVAFKPA